MTLDVGAAAATIDVPVSTPMSGYAARAGGSLGTHDPCTARALAVGDTWWVAIDVCGVDAATSNEIRRRVGGDGAVTATHTHSGPACTPGRLGGDDPAVRARVVEAAATAVTAARDGRAPMSVRFSSARSVGVAVNRRDPAAAVDPPVDLVRFETAGGRVAAWLVTYPCHPVVLSADNRLVSADYVAALRTSLESSAPGSVAVFLPGTAGNVNNGHAAEASYTAAAQEGRTFEEAERVGERIARAAQEATAHPVDGEGATLARSTVPLRLEPLDADPPAVLGARWQEERTSAEAGRAALLDAWIDWATTRSADESMQYDATMTLMRWGGLTLVGLPGEPFLSCADALRQQLSGPVIVTGYTDDCPGYLPDADAYDHGGYEVVDAHRYYGMPAPFARGSAERLVAAVAALAGR